MTGKKIIPSTLILFLIIVLSSALFRITNLTMVEFKADEAINLFLASRPLFGHPFPPGGTVSSVGLLNPPLLNYLLFPFVLISLDPKVISFFIGLVNSLAIGFFFLLIRRYYNTTVALMASLLFAFSPWSILLSRKIWAQDLILPFLVLLLYSLHKVVLDKKMIYWLPYVVSSLLLFQLHQSSLIFLLLLNGFLLIKKVKTNLTYIALGFILGIIPMLPYLIYIANNLSLDPQAFLISKERFGHQYFLVIFLRPLQILSQGNFHFVLGEDMLTLAQRFPLAYHLRRFFYLEYLLLPLGALVFWKNYPRLRFLVYLTLGLPLIYFLARVEPFIHYFAILLPILFLFLASGLFFLLSFKNSILKIVALGIFSALIGISVIFNIAFFSLLNEQKALKGDYGTTLIMAEREVKERLKKYQDNKEYREMVLASYLPKNLLYGNLPVAKMIYSPEETRGRLSLLEERLREVPEDARVHNELLAFYTSSPPTAEIVALLKKKSEALPGYQPIYEEVHRLFVKQNH